MPRSSVVYIAACINTAVSLVPGLMIRLILSLGGRDCLATLHGSLSDKPRDTRAVAGRRFNGAHLRSMTRQ